MPGRRSVTLCPLSLGDSGIRHNHSYDLYNKGCTELYGLLGVKLRHFWAPIGGFHVLQLNCTNAV